MDTVDKETRSRIMSLVKSKHNRSTERRFRSYLMHSELRGWRIHAADIQGVPDVVFDKRKLAVFIDGCFWHGCRAHLRRPHSNKKYWQKKIDENVRRDKRNRAALRRQGWQVLRIWEHEIGSSREVIHRVAEIARIVKQE